MTDAGEAVHHGWNLRHQEDRGQGDDQEAGRICERDCDVDFGNHRSANPDDRSHDTCKH